MTVPHHIDRRTALQTAGGILAGTTILPGSVTAQSGLQLDIRQERLRPTPEGVISAKVRIPEPRFHPQEVPEAYHLGLSHYAAIGDGVVIIHDENLEKFAQPVRVGEIPGSEWLMDFPKEAIDFEAAIDAEAERVEMVLAFPGDQWAPDDAPDWFPGDQWATDLVRVVQPRDL